MTEQRGLCPYFSTAQVVAQGLQVLHGEALIQEAITLKGIQGISGSSAREPGKATVNPRKPFVAAYSYKNRIPEELARDIEGGKIKVEDIPPEVLKPVADPLSVTCIGDKCEKWCLEHSAPKCASGCDRCQIEIMIMAFSASLKASKQSLEAPEERTLQDEEPNEESK
jgi:hypothetical protein